MRQTLNEQSLRNIVIGATLFGGGGGGSIIEGNALIDLMAASGKPVSIQMDELADMDTTIDGKEVTSVMVAALGSPAATKGLTFADEGRNAVSRMMLEAERDGKLLKYIYSGEQGGGNTMLPLYIAFLLDMPVLDLDGNGRAVPAMDTGLPPIYHVPTSPVVLASGKGDTLVARTNNPYDSRACEDIARHMCEVYDQGIGFSAWLMNKEQHSNSAVGQITLSMQAGDIFSNSTRADILEKLEKFLYGINRFRPFVKNGVIDAIKLDTGGGFDTGYTIIKDLETKAEYRVLFQNENLVLFDSSNAALATVPGIISLIDLAPEGCKHPVPVSNAETYVGQNVALVYMDAPSPWYNNPKGYTCWRDILVSAGYCTLNPQVTP